MTVRVTGLPVSIVTELLSVVFSPHPPGIVIKCAIMWYLEVWHIITFYHC